MPSALRNGEAATGLSKPVRPRMLRLLQAIVVEAERRGYSVQLAPGRHRGHHSRRSDAAELVTITAQGQLCGISFGQEQDRTEHVPTAKELADAERYSWARIPTYDHVPSDRLTITLNGGTTHRQSTWRDIAGRPLEDQLPELLQEVDLRGLAAARKRAEQEEQSRLKRRRWEAAMEQAHADYAEAFRLRVLEQQENAWRRAARLSAYLAAASDRIDAMPERAVRTAAEAWLSWAKAHVRALDPLSGPLHLPEVPEPRHDDLKPFLNGWSPYGPHGR